MRKLRSWILFSSLLVGSAACHGDGDDAGENDVGSGAKVARRLVEQVPSPVDIKTPPEDAVKTASGLIYKKLASTDVGAQPKLNEKVLVRYTGWRQRTGETFFTTKSSQPIAMDIAHAAPGFREALPLLHKGEKMVLWLPPSTSTPEPVVYEVELVDILSPPNVAKRTTSGGQAPVSAGSPQFNDHAGGQPGARARAAGSP